MTVRDPKIYNVHEAKTHLSKLLERVEKGEEVVIARAGTPIALLSAITQPTRRQPGLLKGWDVPDSFFDPLPEEELARWEGGGS